MASESHALEELLEANGILPEQFPSVASTVTHLEMFLHHYPRMEGLHHFPALKTLALIHQELKEIQGLEGCPLLEKLWLQENEISTIQGLDSLHRLKELYLYSNHITEIRGLNKLTQLEVLWLSDNYLTRISGLEQLAALRELHLARNDIAFLGDGLSGCTALTHLNLADNKIGSFKELRALAVLPRLVDLCFSDPMWGDCPLAQLCNYQTFVLFVMPHLTSLDTLLLADETKALAEATFLKKQMYYNMRVKTLRRNARQIVKLAAEGRQARQALRQPLKNTLLLASKDLEREISDFKTAAAGAASTSATAAATAATAAEPVAAAAAEGSGGGEPAAAAEGGGSVGAATAATAASDAASEAASDAAMIAALESKLVDISTHLARYSAAEAELDAQFETASERTYALLDGLVARMMLELDTAGNIRLEDGRSTDLWYASCTDLVASRFNPADFPTSLGVNDLHITGVTRIHNRWLRSRFESALGALQIDTSDPSHKRSLEYLFLGEHPGLPGLLDMAVEEGLPDAAQLAAQGLDGAVVLSNSVFLADRLRLAAALDPCAPAATAAAGGHSSRTHGSSTAGAAAAAASSASSSGASNGLSDNSRSRGRLMIVKAYLGRSAQDMSVNVSSALPTKLYGKDGKLSYNAMVEGGQRIMPAAWPEADAVYRVRPGDMKQKLWYVFNNVLVLPEYLVDFTYEVNSAGPLAANPSATSAAAAAARTSASGIAATAATAPSSSSTAAAGGPPPPVMALDLTISSGGLGLSSATHQAILDSLDADIRPLARPMLGWLALQADPSLLRQGLCAEEDEAQRLVAAPPLLQPVPKIYRLTEEAISKAVNGMTLANVVRLDLHNSGLRKMEALSSLRHLQVLVLCYNELTRLEGLEGLVQLRVLDLGHNSIRKVEASLKGLYSLTHLDLSSNQVLKLEELYNMKKYSPQLVILDLRDNPICNDKAYRSTTLRKLKRLERFDGRPVSAEEKERFGEHAGAVTLPMVLEYGSVASRGNGSLADPSRPTEPASITDLSLERMHIRRLQQLASLTSLKRASLADNEISSLEGIEGCRTLEELSLEANRVSSLVGLGGLTRVRKLQLGQNRLASLEALTGLTGLVQLSVEDNELASLSGVERLTNLMELYAGNNRITELREVQRLRDMPKLIILDLAGNPLAGSLASAAAAAAAAAAANATGAGGTGSSSGAAPSAGQVGTGASSVAAAAAAAAVSDDYRLYVIFNVRKLKVLDGVAVSAVEQAAAKNRYAGRLTADFLEERLGHRLFDRIRDLDCSGLRIRDVGNVFLSEDMEGLQELNLDSNMLVEVSALALLRNLVVLRLNNNRLGEECCFNTTRMMERNPELARALAARQLAAQQAGSGGHMQWEIFPNLQVLQLGGNQVSSVSSLQLGALTGLRSLFLQANDITRIEGLDGLINLQELVLDRNRIRYIDPDALTGLPKLRELRLEENGLRSLSGFNYLARSLQALHVGSNRIGEPADLDRLTCLTGLVEVTLAGNPISRKNTYRAMVIAKCPRIQVLDQQMVTAEERDYAEQLFAPTQQPPSLGMALGPPGLPSFMPLMPANALTGSPGGTAEALLAAMVTQGGGAGGSGGVAATPAQAKQPIKLTNMDFAGVTGTPSQGYTVQTQPSSAGSVPSIQANTVVLTGPASFGLEGVGIAPGAGQQGGQGTQTGPSVWPGMATAAQVGSRAAAGRGSGGVNTGVTGAAGLALAGRGTGSTPVSGSSPLRKGQGPPAGRSPGSYK
ncbi:hypothetical protein Agub_g13641 [Astrephomene gubernaculifera]|uniref:U2A'/phosphoprotein 32 family A C-terminal domain-containing protein n=1 Tax=Astrephomene gubernaculifera TaxID=47775 RepID=A0AAD3E0L2_9CHLO|nr:hypothetical protein Agub_g13641 [Astrephomene gubernaculifera]